MKHKTAGNGLSCTTFQENRNSGCQNNKAPIQLFNYLKQLNQYTNVNLVGYSIVVLFKSSDNLAWVKILSSNQRVNKEGCNRALPGP